MLNGIDVVDGLIIAFVYALIFAILILPLSIPILIELSTYLNKKGRLGLRAKRHVAAALIAALSFPIFIPTLNVPGACLHLYCWIKYDHLYVLRLLYETWFLSVFSALVMFVTYVQICRFFLGKKSELSRIASSWPKPMEPRKPFYGIS